MTPTPTARLCLTYSAPDNTTQTDTVTLALGGSTAPFSLNGRLSERATWLVRAYSEARTTDSLFTVQDIQTGRVIILPAYGHHVLDALAYAYAHTPGGSVVTSTWDGRTLKPCACGADDWESLDDDDGGACAVYRCKSCHRTIHIELPD